jgi:hypothetical protein
METENIYVSPAIYIEVLAHLDPFQSGKTQDDYMLAGLPDKCAHFRLASYGCENCFASHEEIARERAYEDDIEFARR